MAKDVTESDSPRQALSPAQERALALVLAGRSDGEVAEAVGVCRQTVWRWRHQDARFIAALNAERLQTWSVTRDRLLSLTTKALGVIDRALDAGDVQAALAMLRLFGRSLPEPKPSGPTTPGEVERQRRLSKAIANQEREREEELVKLMADIY
jgi:Homeodomain-like domain